MVNAGCYGLVGAPTFRLLHDSTQRAFLELLNENEIPYEFRKADDIIVLKDTETSILFRSMDNPERLVALNLAFFAIDEAAYCSEDSFLRLQARLREPKAKELAGIASTTPAGLNWIWDRWFGDKKTDDFEAVKAVPGENYHLPTDYYESLAKTYDPRFYQQEILGAYLNLTSGTAYHAFDRDRNVKPTIQYDPSARLAFSFDFNIDPACSVIAQIKDYAPTPWLSTKSTRTIEVIDEVAIRDATVYLSCEQLVAKTEHMIRPGRRLRVEIFGDSAGNNRNHAGVTDWQMVREYFSHKPNYELIWKVPSANPAVKDRVNAVNGALYNSQGETRVTIHPRCISLIRDLERVVWKKDSHGNSVGQISQDDKMLSHSSDALGYLVEAEFSLTRTTGGYKTGRLV